MKTTERLAAALREEGASEDFIALALAGKFDDFLSESATPITDLVRVAYACGLPRIAERARAGEFDGTSEEAVEYGNTAFEQAYGVGPRAYRDN